MAFSPLPPATLRSICSSGVSPDVKRAPAGAFALAVLAVFVLLVARPALADDRAPVDQGRIAARGILIVRDPRACGIAVLHERCIADVDAFLHGRGDTGFNHVLFAAANGDTTGEILAALPATDLARHAASIPADALPVDAAPLRAMSAEAAGARPNIYRMPQLVPFTKTLVAAVRTTVPAPALATVALADTPAADAALGVAFSTMAELIDSPQWVAQGDAQAFAVALAGRLETLVPAAGRADVARFRASVRAGTSFDHDRANAALTAASSAWITSVPRDRAQRFAFAAAAAQLAYNAAVLRSPEASAEMLRVIAASASLDAVIPGWGATRAGAASVGATDWLAQHALSIRLVDLIQKANPA